ncbi:MAG: extracellular solute-binding protein [Beutenbergiaceae bacterium]
MRRLRHTLFAAVAMTALTVAACAPPDTGTDGDSSDGDGGGAPASAEDVPDVPSEPVSLHIIDVAGNLKLTQPMIEAFVEEHPDIISDFTFEAAGAPDLVGTIKPQVDSGNLQIDLVLSGTDGLSAGIAENLWVPVVEEFGDRLPGMQNYTAEAAQMQELAEGYGVLTVYTPSGPLMWFNPNEMDEADVPTTPEELLTWAQANPNRFGYPRPANSGVGRTFLQGLPYMLGDSDPSDPENGWDNTWAYLSELDQYIDYYTTGTGQMVQAVADGTWALTPTTLGWDIEPRADGRAPAEIGAVAFDEFTFVADSQFALMPQGLSADKQSAILNLLEYMLTPEVNAIAFDNGYFYPGPAVEGATIDLAPQSSQDAMAEYGRDWYDDLIANNDAVPPLSAEALVTAFDIWDREIGGNRVQEG